MTLELRFTERTVDLVGEGVEVGIRIGAMPSSSLIARRIGTAERVVVASRAYLQRHPSPRTPEDLADHPSVIHAAQKQADRWTFDSETGRHVVEVKGRLWIDDIDSVCDAVLGGLGIGLVPVWCVRQALAAGQAVALLGDYHAAALPVSAVYPDADGTFVARPQLHRFSGRRPGQNRGAQTNAEAPLEKASMTLHPSSSRTRERQATADPASRRDSRVSAFFATLDPG